MDTVERVQGRSSSSSTLHFLWIFEETAAYTTSLVMPMLNPTINPPFKRVGPLLLFLTAFFVLVWKLPPLAILQGTQVMALWVHITAETFSIVVAGMIFAVTWNAYTAERPAPLIVLACGLLAVGLLDFGHTLSFNGMPDFITPADREKGLNFWLTGRMLFALTMVAIVFLPWTPFRHPQRRYWLLAGNLSLVGLIFWLALYQPQVWPRTFIEGQGLTPFKISVEYGIIGLLLIPAVLFMFQAWRDHKALQADYLASAAVVTILSELAFTLYTDVTDIFNLLGHTYKILAYGFIYRAVFVVSVREPFLRLREANRETQQAKEEWERTFAAIGDIATIQDTKHRILRANRKACEALDLSAEELTGKFCYEVFHGGTQPCDGCPAVLTAMDATTHTAEIVHEGLGRTFAVSASPIFGPDNELRNIIYLSRDITKLKTLEQQLRQAQKMEAIGTLAGGIAHDFNNILTPVLGYSEIISESLPVDSPLKEPAKEILKAGRRARDLVKQILTFSRQTDQERNPLQLHLVIKEALKLLRSSLPSSIEIKQDIASEATVLADPTMIHQVVMNLCTNAYHAMRETGGILGVSLTEVEIGADDYITELHLKPGAYLRLEVSDTGCGMPHDLLERIFEPYFTTKAKGEGTGLGLSMVHGIVTALGGHVTVYSEPDKGTTFHVYLPKCQVKKTDSVTTAITPLPKGDERILVVDDEKVIAELMKKTLAALGYRATTHIDSRQALEEFAANPAAFDLVITDMTMPHLNGAELAQQLLAIRPGLPIILCTGFSEIINEEKAIALGVRRLLMKPVLREELATVLRQALDLPEE